MNKKYIVGGLVFWAGLSGYMGLRILESYTEDAVFAALSAVPAQAQEIRYSFLRNTLTLKGVEYELPDDKIMHKGTMESVEVTGFNRKCMFVKPNMPAYDPDALPIVAESVTVTGIVDTVHAGHTKMEQRVERAHLRGWHQRLGMLLDQHSQHNGEASFFEELYRCSLDGMELSGVTSSVSGPYRQPMRISVAEMALPEGIRAPRGTEKVPSASLRISGAAVAGKSFSGGVQQLDLENLRVLEPAAMAEFLRLNRALDTAEPNRMSANDGDEFIDRLFELTAKNYENRVPFSRAAVQGGTLSVMDAPGGSEVFSLNMALKSLNCTMSDTGDGGFREAVTLDGLKVTLPDAGMFADIFSRYAPDGITLNMSGDATAGARNLSGKVRYELEGLGALEGDLDVSGDIRALRKASMENVPDDTLDELMQTLRLGRLHLTYRDAGLVPMGLELAARWKFDTPEEMLAEALVLVKMLEQSPERPVRELGRALAEQLAAPGEFSMTIAPEQPMNFMEALSLASGNPDALPVTFASKPGTKALKDYLPGERK